MNEMILGVPTMRRYDLLDRLIESALVGTRIPDRILIVDNGGSYAVPEHARDRVKIIYSGENIGVAAAWNKLIQAGARIISNDDIELGPESFDKFASALEKNTPFAYSSVATWSLFALDPSVFARIGDFDEEFFPAYYEDNDYEMRLGLAGIPISIIADDAVKHVRGGTSRNKDGQIIDASEYNEWFRRNQERYVKKWGGIPHQETFRAPFRPDSARKFVRRWDVLNHLAQFNGAKLYMEIGVEDGHSMRNVRIETKWGVDPEPRIDGVRACDVFFRMKSFDFFARHMDDLVNRDEDDRLDLVFIDGWHSAETVYNEVESTAQLLSPKGLIALHDVGPTTEIMQSATPVPGNWTGDVWKAVVRMRREGKHDVRVVDIDFGVAIVKAYAGKGGIDLPADDQLDWNLLQQRRKELLGTIEESELDEWLTTSVPA